MYRPELFVKTKGANKYVFNIRYILFNLELMNYQ